ncbi:MAG: hypothetical protein ABFC90_09590 [Bacteroidales bacterium]|nr:hypothetical protein [Bacteroidales bacterium]
MTNTYQKDFNPSEMLNYFIDTLADAVSKKLQSQYQQPQQETQTQERIKLKGIRGIASYLGIAPSTAQKLRNKNIFPVYFTGGKLFAFSDEVTKSLKYKEIN